MEWLCSNFSLLPPLCLPSALPIFSAMACTICFLSLFTSILILIFHPQGSTMRHPKMTAAFTVIRPWYSPGPLLYPLHDHQPHSLSGMQSWHINITEDSKSDPISHREYTWNAIATAAANSNDKKLGELQARHGRRRRKATGQIVRTTGGNGVARYEAGREWEWSNGASDSDAYMDVDSSAEDTTDDAKTTTTTAPLPALVLLSAPGPNVPYLPASPIFNIGNPVIRLSIGATRP